LRVCSIIFPKTNIKFRIVRIGFRRRNGNFEPEEFSLYATNISTIYSKHVAERPYKFILCALRTK
jgi:hypothetical protein